MQKAYYIAELNLPSKSAYAHHVLKMCDNLSKKFDTTLIIFSKKISFISLKKNYLLKNNFKLLSMNPKITKHNFHNRIKLALFTLSNVDKKSLIISRSLLSAFLLACSNFRLFVEVHHTFKGLTNFFFNIIKKTRYFKNLYFIFINKNLCNFLKISNHFIVLDDAVDLEDFKKIKKNIKYDFTYTGSLFKGKGLEIIGHLSNKFPNYKFHIFGDYSKINIKLYNNKNLIFHGFKNYSEIVKILKQSRYLLMPYASKIYANSDNLEISKFISPLKLFDYMASGKIIFASKLKAYQHIAIHNENCILIPPNNLKLWEQALRKIKFINKKNIISNCSKTVKNFTWTKRVNKINQIYRKFDKK